MTTINISVIIPTRHREQMLWLTVEKAAAAIENRNAEIIIVNDGDNELAVPAKLAGKVGLYKNPKKGVSAARNFGTSIAKGSLLFFIDDDMWIDPAAIDWIANSLLNNDNSGAVYNLNWVYPQPLNEKLKGSKVGQYLLRSGYHTMWGRIGGQGKVPEKGLYLYPHKMIGSGSFVISKDLFEKVGGYNEAVIFQGEDADLAEKLLAAGVKIYCVFDVTLFHNQEDRFEIVTYLKRAASGYASEFNAVKAGLINPAGRSTYAGPSRIVFEFFRVTEKGWILLHKGLPDTAILRPFNNRLTGMLSGLQRYKEWRNIIHKNPTTG